MNPLCRKLGREQNFRFNKKSWKTKRNCISQSVMSNSLWVIQTVAQQGPLSMESPGKNTGVCSPSFAQGIFPTQGSEHPEVRQKTCLPKEINETKDKYMKKYYFEIKI